MAPKVNENQKELMVELMKKYYKDIYGTFNDSQGCLHKNQTWTKIEEQLNKCGPSKSTQQWKKCWLDLKKSLKLKIRKVIKFQQETGGGSITDLADKLTESELTIYEIIGKDYFFGDNVTEEYGDIAESVSILEPDKDVYEIDEGPLLENEIEYLDSDVIFIENDIETTSKTGPTPSKPKKQKMNEFRTPARNAVLEAKAECEKTNKLLEQLITQQLQTQKIIVREQTETRKLLKDCFDNLKNNN